LTARRGCGLQSIWHNFWGGGGPENEVHVCRGTGRLKQWKTCLLEKPEGINECTSVYATEKGGKSSKPLQNKEGKKRKGLEVRITQTSAEDEYTMGEERGGGGGEWCPTFPIRIFKKKKKEKMLIHGMRKWGCVCMKGT